MVIVKEDNTPIQEWILGRIVNVIQGNDGLVRVADVRTPNGTFRRSIQKLAPLPVEDETTEDETSEAADGNITEDENPPNNESPTRKTEHTASKHPSEYTVGNSRKKQRKTLGCALLTMLITCLMIPSTYCSPVTITPFKSQPGVYFENLGVTNIISDEWQLVAYYEMDPYWKEFRTFVNYTTQLEKLCNVLTERGPCVQITNQFKQLKKDLTRNNELLQPPIKQLRNKRGAVNFIGNIANSLFGVLDSEYANQMSKTIGNIEKNQAFLLDLIKNQTSLVDATVNIMKREEESINNQFHDLEAQINQITKQWTDIREELYQEKTAQLFTSMAIQIMLIASNFHRMQDAIVDVMVDTHHGKISPQLLSPAQLRKELANIKNNLPSNTRLPTMQNDILKFYNIMTIQGRATEKHIIFKISLPLLTIDDFELFQVIPVPVPINNTFVAIKPSSPYLVINLHRDLYYPLTEQEVAACISIDQGRHFCKQNRPIYHKGSAISACEVEFLNHLPHSDNCLTMKTGEGPHWIQMHNPNQWIYSLKNKTTINIVCGDNITQTIIEGAGILKIQGNCIIKQTKLTIKGQNTYLSNTRLSYTPSSNLTEFLSIDKLDPIVRHTSHYHPDLTELELIKKQLAQLPRDLPARLNANDNHQYAIGYIGLILAILIISYLSWKHLKIRPWNDSEDKQQQPDSKPTEITSFDTNFEI